MATQVQFRGGTTTEHASFNGAAREVTVDTTKQTLVVQDGTTNGGFPLLRQDLNNLPAGTITSADIGALTANLAFNANVGAVFASDMTISHDGDHATIDNNDGNLYIKTQGTMSLFVSDSDDAISMVNGGATTLYWDSSPKVATTSTGADVTGTITATGQITGNSSNSGKYVRMYGAAGTGRWDIYGHGANLRFSDNDSAGNIHFDTKVGIGQDAPSGDLHITNGTRANIIVAKSGLTVKQHSELHTSYDVIQLGAGGGLASYNAAAVTADTYLVHNAYRGDTGSWEYRYDDTAMRLRMNSPANTFIWDTAASGTAGDSASFSEVMKLDSDGDLTISDGNLVVASGHGIDFSSTADADGSGISMQGELLDDYERGTWGSINSGADSCTFSHNWYVKIGRVVTCNIRLSGITNGNGAALTVNLPFANGTVEASGSVACDTFNMPSDWFQMTAYAYDSKLYILNSRDNDGWENLLGNMTATNTTLIMNITYLSNS